MGSRNENARLGRIARGIVYPMVILLVMLLTFEIFTSFKKHASSALDLPRKRTQHEVAPKARVYATSERLRNEEAQELLLESLTLMRDLMVDIRSGSKENALLRNVHHINTLQIIPKSLAEILLPLSRASSVTSGTVSQVELVVPQCI